MAGFKEICQNKGKLLKPLPVIWRDLSMKAGQLTALVFIIIIMLFIIYNYPN